MADAFTTVMSNLDTRREQAARYENEANQIRANTFSTTLENGAKLANTLYTQKVEEETTKLQNYINEQAAYGKLNWVNPENEEEGIQYDPEEIYKNYQNCATNWINENVKGSLLKSSVTKSATSLLEGMKANIISNANSNHYDTVRQNSKNSVAQLTSISFDPYNEDALNVKIAAAYPDYTSSTDLTNVTDFGIGDDAKEYNALLEKSKTEEGLSAYEKYQLEELSFRLNYKLNSKIAGESEYQYEHVSSKNYEDALTTFRVAQGMKAMAGGEGEASILEEYKNNGYNSNVITKYTQNIRDEILNKGGVVVGQDENGKDIIITTAEMGDTGIDTAVQEYTNYLNLQAANALRTQDLAWQNATKQVTDEYNSSELYAGTLPFTSEDEYIAKLREIDGSLDDRYAKAQMRNNVDLQQTFRKNAESEKMRKAIEMYFDGTDMETLYDYLDTNKLIYTASHTWGWNNLEIRSDDDVANSFMVAYDRYKNEENLSDAEIRTLLFRNGTPSSVSETSYPTNIWGNETSYKEDRSRAVTSNIDTLSDLAVTAISEGAGTVDGLYEENGFDSKQNVEFTATVNEIMEDEELSDYIAANHEAGKEIIQAKWTINNVTATDEEKTEATNILQKYKTKAAVRADNETYVTLAENYLTASGEEKKTIEEKAAEDGTLDFISALSEDSNLGSKARSEAMADGKVDRAKLADIINKWNGESVSVEDSYKTGTGKETLENAQDYYADRDWEAYSEAAARGAVNGDEGIESELEKAGFTKDDPNYNKLKNLWKNLDQTIKNAMQADKTGETARKVMSNLYGSTFGTIDADTATNELKAIKDRQALYESNENAFNILDVWMDPEAYTEEQRTEAERQAVEGGYIEFLSDTLGMNSLTDLTDDDMSNEVRMAYESAKAEAEANGIEWDYDHKKKAILQILADKNLEIEKSKALTPTDISAKASEYYSGKNSKAFSNEAVELLASGLSIEEAKKELEKNYPVSYNRKLYNGVFAYLENDEELQEALVGADEEKVADVVAAITTIVNSTGTTDAKVYELAAEGIISSLKTSYKNREANVEIGKELAPLFDENALAEDYAKAEQYMKDNNLYNLEQDENFRKFVKGYSKENGISIAEAISYGLEDLGLNTVGKGTFAGFTEDLTSENRVYNWVKSKTWDESQEVIENNKNYPEKKQELIDSLSSGKAADTSFEGYSDLQSVRDSIAGNKLLSKACSLKDGKGNNLYDVEAIVNAQYNIQNLPDKTEYKETIKESREYIKKVEASVALQNNYNLISLGYAYEHGYDASKKEGYSDIYLQSLMKQAYASMVDQNGLQTYENVLATMRQLDAAGISYDDFEKTWATVTAEDVETMDWSTFYSIMSKLDEPLEKLARRSYSSFEYDFKDTESMSSALYTDGATNEEVLGYEHNDAYGNMQDKGLTMAYASGLAAFGESYQGWTPSKSLLNTGSVGSAAYNDTISLLAAADSEEAWNNVLAVRAPKILTPDAISELKKYNPISLAVRQEKIPGYENYDFWASVGRRASGSTFGTLEQAGNLDDYKSLVGFSEVYNAKTQDAINEYNNNPNKETAAVTFGERMKELEIETINAYNLQEIQDATDKESKDAKVKSLNSSLSTDKFNIITEFETKTKSSTKEAKRQENAQDFFGNFESSVQQISAQCGTKDFDTESIIYNWAHGTSNLSSETDSELCGRLMNPEITGKARAGLIFKLSLNLMGYPTEGLSDTAFIDDYNYSARTTYDIIEGMDDVEKLRLAKLAVNLHEKFDLLSNYNALGYGTSYSLDVNGDIVDKTYGKVSHKDGAYISTKDDKQRNLTLDSNNVNIDTKTEFLFGEYYSDGALTKSTSHIKLDTPKDTAIDIVSNYNKQKFETYGDITDFAKASEMAVESSFYSYHPITSVKDYNRSSPYKVGWNVQEITGEEIAKRYKKLIEIGDVSTQIMYLSQFSPEMQEYVAHVVVHGNYLKK